MMNKKSRTGTFTCIDAHTCGNPVRVVADGGPELDGASMLERRETAQAGCGRAERVCAAVHSAYSGIARPSQGSDCT